MQGRKCGMQNAECGIARKPSSRFRILHSAFRIFTFAWLAVLAPQLTACSREGSSPDAFLVAVVVPGSTADQGWNYSAKEGAELIQRELGLVEPVSFIENVESSQRKSVLRSYGRKGYDLVFCHGYEFHQVVKEVVDEFPETRFVVSGYDQPDERFGSIVYQLGEAAYLCGVIAAHATESGHVGFIAAQRVPPVVLCHDGFRKGFLDTKPDGEVRDPQYIEGANPWEDSAAAKVRTQAMLRNREPAPIDVLFQNADAASRGIFVAVEEHPQRIFVFGANRDQNDTSATSKVLASAVIRVDDAFLRVARAVRNGTFEVKVHSETLATGGIDCVLSPRLADLVGDEKATAIIERVAAAKDGIIRGAIEPYDHVD